MPLVTVALQFFNAERTLAEAVRSILKQTFADWELLLQNDGSTDASLEVARSFRDPRVRILSDGINRRRPARINEGIRLAAGRYFALMDADDVAYPDRLARQVSFLDREPPVDLVGGAMLVFDDRGVPRGKRVGPAVHDEICRRPWAGFLLAQPTFVGRTEWFRKYGYRDGTAPTEDQDLLIRSHRHSRFANLPEVVMGYREAGLTVRKQLFARRQVTKALVRELLQESRPILAARAALEQAGKAAVDVFAVASGLDYRILGHRAGPITEEEASRWRDVYESVR
ncbi:MAG: glycosyltransferase [Thermoanaerobaculia bacterium]